MKKYFECKHGVCLDDIQMIHPNLFIMLSTVLSYSAKHDLPVVITSLINDRDGVVSKSSTHSTGRAVDLSIRGWNDHHLNDLELLINTKHSDIGAISASTLKPRPILIHNVSYGAHMHLQVKP
jgi:hypothetical protein